jgi:hypothetical protein
MKDRHAHALVGTSRLVSWENRGIGEQVTHPMGADPLAYLVYPDGPRGGRDLPHPLEHGRGRLSLSLCDQLPTMQVVAQRKARGIDNGDRGESAHKVSDYSRREKGKCDGIAGEQDLRFAGRDAPPEKTKAELEPQGDDRRPIYLPVPVALVRVRKPVAKTETCQEDHVGYVVKGRLHDVHADDDVTEAAVVPGAVYHLLPVTMRG